MSDERRNFVVALVNATYMLPVTRNQTECSLTPKITLKSRVDFSQPKFIGRLKSTLLAFREFYKKIMYALLPTY